MKKVFFFSLIVIFLLISFPEAKLGSIKSSGFKSYNSSKFLKERKDLSKKEIQKKSYKQNINTSIKKKPSFLNNPIFKWIIGGLIFGAILSFLLGYGFQIGAPGLLEILLIGGIIYFLFKRFKKKPTLNKDKYINQNTFLLGVDEEKKTKEREEINEIYLRNMIKNMYKAFLKSWSKGDLISIKDYLTDKLYNHLEMQLMELTEKGFRNVVKDIKVKNVDIIHIEDKDNVRKIVAEIETEMIDYIEDNEGNIISGDKNKPIKKKEYWVITGKSLNWKIDDIKQIED
ncbi:MAG: TIM44-like domain-containing protein [Aquificae bacterium]|nr:TIM44-like domain-containing protein [Aquificota bacterium]